MILTALLLLLATGCDKDPLYPEGDYRYENKDLTYLENIDGILIHWDEQVTEEQQEAIREIVSAMVRVEGGTFQMGSDSGLANDDEQPVHAVTLSNYRIGKFTITQKQWKAIMGGDPGWNSQFGLGDEYPATQISADDVRGFLNVLKGLSGLNFRLPTEAEWEYAARGGKSLHGTLYSGSDDADAVAWHQGNAGNRLHPVGSLQPNELGLYDMSGNVWEWCSDRYGAYSAEAQTNPQGPNSGQRRVVRGGSFSYEAAFSRVTQRNSIQPNTQSFAVGFRLAMDEQK